MASSSFPPALSRSFPPSGAFFTIKVWFRSAGLQAERASERASLPAIEGGGPGTKLISAGNASSPFSSSSQSVSAVDWKPRFLHAFETLNAFEEALLLHGIFFSFFLGRLEKWGPFSIPFLVERFITFYFCCLHSLVPSFFYPVSG